MSALVQDDNLKLKIINDLLILITNNLKGQHTVYLQRLASLFSVVTNRFRDLIADR